MKEKFRFLFILFLMLVKLKLFLIKYIHYFVIFVTCFSQIKLCGFNKIVTYDIFLPNS